MPGYGLGATAVDRSEKLSLLQAAVEGGISYIDTAAAYAESEDLLGKLMDLLSAHQVRLCTKISGDARCTVKIMRRKLDASLQRLHCGGVDTVLLHSAKQGELMDPSIGELFESAKRDHRVCFTGASTYGVKDARIALALPWSDVLQTEYSILNQSVVRTILMSVREDQEIVVRSVLCKGLLTGRRRNASGLIDELGPVIDKLEVIAAGWGYSLPELAIRFALDTPRVNVVLVGVSNKDELDIALGAKDREPLTQEQMDILAKFDCSEMDCVHPERWENLSV